MNDLIERAAKYARSAGRTGLGQYRAATLTGWVSGILIVVSAALSAVVGTSIFAQWSDAAHGHAAIVFGLLAIAAAALTAIDRVANLGARAEAHRVAGAEYGRLRRQADMLRLRIAGRDIERAAALAELEQLGEALSKTARDTRALPDYIYQPAKRAFDKMNSGMPSHAGGVVFRDRTGTIEFLIVQAKEDPCEWVLPKGHIKDDESAEQAARREVREEAGVDAGVFEVLDTVDFSTPRGPVRARFFLMQYLCAVTPREYRGPRWLRRDEAVEMLSFKEAQRLVLQAEITLRGRVNVGD